MRIIALALLISTPALADDTTPLRYRGVEKLLKENLEKVKKTAERERAREEARTRS